MTDLPAQGKDFPQPQQVTDFIDFPSTSKIVTESMHDNLYMALVRAPDDEQIEGAIFRKEGENWIPVDKGADNSILHAVGRDPSRRGKTIVIGVGTRIVQERVSPDGWWAVVAKVDDRTLPENQIRLPDPYEEGVTTYELHPLPRM